MIQPDLLKKLFEMRVVSLPEIRLFVETGDSTHFVDGL